MFSDSIGQREGDFNRGYDDLSSNFLGYKDVGLLFPSGINSVTISVNIPNVSDYYLVGTMCPVAHVILSGNTVAMTFSRNRLRIEVSDLAPGSREPFAVDVILRKRGEYPSYGIASTEKYYVIRVHWDYDNIM